MSEGLQCEWGRPVPQRPHEPGVPVHEGPSLTEPPEDANTESRFDSWDDPQWGHLVPFHLLERTRISLSFLHFPQ